MIKTDKITNFTFKRVNSPFDDSGIFVRNVYMKEAVLFDCGRLGSLDNSQLSNISSIFVTHAHMDHFSGFDRFLRGCLLSNKTFKLFGPKGFINNVKGKLAGYTWNLIKDYNISFLVSELLEDNKVVSSIFSAKNNFQEEHIGSYYKDKIILDDDFSLEYEILDHGIPCIAYRLKEPKRISINKDSMSKYGYKIGPWIKNLKEALLLNANEEISVISENGVVKEYAKDLGSKIAEYPKVQDITYITDIAPSFDNYKKAVNFSKESFILIIESVFMNKDLIHAIEKNHLNIGLSKCIYINSCANYVSFGHFASKYDRMRDIFFKELYEGLDKSKIIKLELAR